jgi:DNA-binding CsgD family transcriptional regulator/N-acetylneuraminic acid mutarotase
MEMSEEAISLSEREREILRLVATGATNQQIAGDLGISINTVKVHLRNIFGKIGAASRTEATLYAMRSGLVDVGAVNGAALLTAEPPVASRLVQPNVAPAPPPAKPGLLQRYGLIVSTSVGGILIALVVLLLLGVRLGGSAGEPTAAPTASTGVQVANSTATWAPQRDLPEAITAAAATSADGRIYIIGGRTAKGISGRVWRFDPATNSLATLPEKPLAVADASAVVLGGKIWVPGGAQTGGTVSSQLDVYDPANQSWATKAALPQPRSGYGLAAVDGRLYLLGGWDGTRARAETFMYDPANDSWTELDPMPSARAYCSATAVDGKIYVLGGEDATGPSVANEQFTPALDGKGSWAKVTPLPQPRTKLSTATVSNNIVVLGGTQDEQPARYDVRTSEWQSVKGPALPLGPQPAAAVRDSSVYVAAGDTSKAASAFYEMRLLYTVTLPIQ